MSEPLRPSRSALRTTMLFVGALLFLFEEWLWGQLTRFFRWLGRFGVMRWLDARLARLPPFAALLMLCLPMLLLFPFKIAGLWMIASGRFFSGCLLMLVAKVLSTAVIARIFLACKPQLLQMPWFARLHAWTCALRDRIHHWIAEQPAWRQARHFMAHVKNYLRGWRQRPMRRSALYRWRTRRKARRTAPVGDLASVRDPGPKRR